jgi:hypothetical protein
MVQNLKKIFYFQLSINFKPHPKPRFYQSIWFQVGFVSDKDGAHNAYGVCVYPFSGPRVFALLLPK